MATKTIRTSTLVVIALMAVLFGLAAQAQTIYFPPIRGVYTPGLNSMNSGVLPEPGFTYANVFATYSFDTVVGPHGNTVNRSPSVGVDIDLNIFYFVPKKKILGGNLGMMGALPISNSTIESVKVGTVGGGFGLADTFYQPLIMGWHLKRADVQAGYAFFAPTGSFTPGASNNTGTGHWTNAPFSGQTVYLTKNKATAVSAWEMWEFHTTQSGTNIHPGATMDLDYSVTQILPLKKNESILMQVGFIGYGQWQLSNATGPTIDPAIQSNIHYAVNAIGIGGNFIFPARKTSFGFKWFNEVSNKSTVQGQSLQISGAITF